MKVSVIMACFNRAEKTKLSIEKLLLSGKNSKYSIKLTFFVCNDGSTDATADVLASFGDVVKQINGTGNLYWARGMAKALREAEKYDSDFYLMVNDDVDFCDDILDIMIGSYRKYNDDMATIVGDTKDDRDESFTYGGYIWNGKAIKKKMKPVVPNDAEVYCNTANWNCVLMPNKVYKNVGEIDEHYEHSFADFDYSNRLTRAGYQMYVAEKYVGYCRRNDDTGTWRDKGLGIKKRIQLLHKPNGFPPKSSWRYARKYYGVFAPLVFVKPYASILKNAIFKK